MDDCGFDMLFPDPFLAFIPFDKTETQVLFEFAWLT